MASVEGLPSHPELWQRNIIAVDIVSNDQATLSGIMPAPDGRPIEEGAYIAYRLGTDPRQRRKGNRASVEFTADGRHVLTYEAFDLAGNASGEKSVSFKIDRTPPTGAFGLRDASDPRQLSVEVSDATSGLADGRIEFRREGQEGFREIPTALEHGRLRARMDDLALSAGRYEVRAVVNDVAGNRAVIDRRLDGSSMLLGLPLRRAAEIEVKAATTVRRCVQAKARHKGKAKRKAAKRKRANRRKCRKQTAERPAGRALELSHGKSFGSVGRITEQGAPLAAAEVTVEGQPRSGGPFVRLGVARADAHGAFRFVVPPGPSRAIRYSYGGSNTVRPSTAQLVTKVKAAARLRANRRRLVNGQAVRFSGRLLGKPIPSGGKLVALQAKVGRKWRTFATPRANAKGVFRHRYRFTSTTGVRRYAFRAVIAREAAYPYEAGVSRIVRVTVRGR